MADFRLGIIGGTGLGEALGALGEGEVREVETPFGRPSAPIVLTEVDGVPLALLSRHGNGHRFNPTQVPYRANLYALKSLGVTHVLASGAVGSLREEIAPRHLVIPDQAMDRTIRRASTFFEELSVHVDFAEPFCPHLRRVLLAAGEGMDVPVHPRGTYLCMEGPQLSTRAESQLHRTWGADLIGMTLMPEAKLAREAELCYATVALVTDYDCWRPHPPCSDAPSVIQEIVGNLKGATANALVLLRRALPKVAEATRTPCACQSALRFGVWSDRRTLGPEASARLALLLPQAP